MRRRRGRFTVLVAVAATHLIYTSFERGIVAWLCILVGAWFLFRATVNKRQKNAMKELLGVQIDKIKFFRNYFIQRLEGIVGFSFVLIGVGIHLYVIIRQAQTYEADILTGNTHFPLASSAISENTMPVSGGIRGSATSQLITNLAIEKQ